MPQVMKGDIQEYTQLTWDVRVLTPLETNQQDDFQ
jgi:hypothetical protein